LPAGFTPPPGRTKPWGTGQAILMAADAIRDPFAAINADDFYGANSFRVLADQLRSGADDFTMVGFILRNTLSEFGSVARGVCRTGAQDFLESVTEIVGIEKDGAGAKYRDDQGAVHRFTGDETVSMNMWGFNPALFGRLREQFTTFLRHHGQQEKSEFYIPRVVNDLVAARQARVKVLRTNDSWFGVTYREDRPLVVEGVRRLVAGGVYPETLRA